jgi:CelD/BcsL family acetyltransferase involved in cellulose biosynthesis
MKIDSLYLEEITSASSLASLYEDWLALWLRSPGATPFSHPAWIVNWWKNFAAGTLCTFALHQAGRLAAIAPFHIIRDELGRNMLLFIATGPSDYLDILAESDAAGRTAVQVIFEYLVIHRDLWDICDLHELAANSPLLAAESPEGINADVSQISVCPAIDLPPTFAEYDGMMQAVHRRKVLKARRELLQIGPLSLERAGADDFRQFTAEFFALHEASWKSRGGGVLGRPKLREFHLAIAEAFLDHDVLGLFRLCHGGRTIATVYGFEHESTFYSYLGGFDPDFAPYSPGSVILLYLIEDCVNRGIRRFDFLRGTERYKRLWAAANRPNSRLVLT